MPFRPLIRLTLIHPLSRHLFKFGYGEPDMYLPLLLSPANRLIISVALFISLASSMVFAQALPSAQAQAQAPQAAESTMKRMVSAIQANSLPDFVAPGDEAFQAGMTKEMLGSINQSLASRLGQGYSSTFLTRLKQQGFEVYVWKLEFKDGNDDVLVFLAVKDGKVGGFWLR
jgi:hypothetical protein